MDRADLLAIENLKSGCLKASVFFTPLSAAMSWRPRMPVVTMTKRAAIARRLPVVTSLVWTTYLHYLTCLRIIHVGAWAIS